MQCPGVLRAWRTTRYTREHLVSQSLAYVVSQERLIAPTCVLDLEGLAVNVRHVAYSANAVYNCLCNAIAVLIVCLIRSLWYGRPLPNLKYTILLLCISMESHHQERFYRPNEVAKASQRTFCLQLNSLPWVSCKRRSMRIRGKQQCPCIGPATSASMLLIKPLFPY